MSKPSFPEFVVALFLARSKPPGTAIRDYIAKIRSHVKHGRRPDDRDGARYTDTLAFWKESHQRLQEELNEQKARVFVLERQLDEARSADPPTILPEVLKKRPAPDPAPVGCNKKRKTGNTEVAEAVNEGRRDVAGTALLPADPLDMSRPWTHADTFSTQVDGRLLDDLITGLCDAAYVLQKSLLQTPLDSSMTSSLVLNIVLRIRTRIISVQPLKEARGVAEASSSLSLLPPSSAPIIDDSVMFHPSSPLQPSDGSRDVVSPGMNTKHWRSLSNKRLLDGATGRTIFTILFSAMDQIGHIDDSDATKGQLIYAVVQLLKDTLDQICQLASVTPTNNQIKNGMLTRLRSSQGKQPTELQTLDLVPADDIMGICSFLVGALQSLQKGRPADEAIKEGFTFFLLGRVGKVLKAFVFGEDDELFNAVYAEGGNAKIVSLGDCGHKLATKKRQAPYLIWLLERSMVCWSLDTPSVNQGAARTATKVDPVMLTEKLKDQLQHTILKEVLGDDIQGFKDCLEERHDPRINIEPWQPIKQANVMEFFKAEVWRLLGWDCLISCME
ncbi:MAG: hypothetical protein Q9184_003474 [Pyrenodesmia sp. 2 TL-2023]